MTMKEELAALKKKFDAGKLTKFKYNQGVRDIKKNYGKAAPSNVGKIINFISAKVGPAMTAKGGAKGAAARKKAAEQTARSDRQLIKKARNEKAKQTPRADTPTKRAAPKFNPSGLKMSTKSMEKALVAKSDNIKTPPSKRDGKGNLILKSSGKKLSKFEQAFADARKAGKKTFKFTNRAGNTTTYTTERKDKKPLPKKGKK